MAHKEQLDWCTELHERFPERFRGHRVLEVGSYNINGSIRPLFDACWYLGIDVRHGRDVDRVAIAHELDAPVRSFSVVCSCNALEHDMYWRLTLGRMYALLANGGLMFVQARARAAPHGTASANPEDSLTSQLGEPWASYYRNLDVADLAWLGDDNLFGD